MACRPNIFSRATKELSQDAVIAWLADWADQSCRVLDLEMHELGKRFLNSLLDKHGLSSNVEVQDITVRMQERNVDVWIEVNNQVLILVEDKTNTGPHDHQLETYMEVAEATWIVDGDPSRHVIGIYCKTGNESLTNNLLPKDNKWKRFTRGDFLNILPKPAQSEIVTDFRGHLQVLEDEANRYRRLPYGQWTHRSYEGFFSHLERELRSRGRSWGWVYVPNQRGGFLDFNGAWCFDEGRRVQVYLQMQGRAGHAPKLYFRAYGREHHPHISVEDCRSMLSQLQGAGLTHTVGEGIDFSKPARLRGGATAAVAVISDVGEDPWISEPRSTVWVGGWGRRRCLRPSSDACSR